MADGAATITATAFDTAGLTKTSSVNVVIDNTKPLLGVTGPDEQAFPSGSTQSWAITAADPTTGIAQLRCSLVAFGAPASFGACSGAGRALGDQQAGGQRTRFSVRAIDGAGNVTDVARSFKIDATAPDTTIASGLADGGVDQRHDVDVGARVRRERDVRVPRLSGRSDARRVRALLRRREPHRQRLRARGLRVRGAGHG